MSEIKEVIRQSILESVAFRDGATLTDLVQDLHSMSDLNPVDAVSTLYEMVDAKQLVLEVHHRMHWFFIPELHTKYTGVVASTPSYRARPTNIVFKSNDLQTVMDYVRDVLSDEFIGTITLVTDPHVAAAPGHKDVLNLDTNSKQPNPSSPYREPSEDT